MRMEHAEKDYLRSSDMAAKEPMFGGPDQGQRREVHQEGERRRKSRRAAQKAPEKDALMKTLVVLAERQN